MIEAKPTKYKGTAYRSRLEAKWANFFDALGVKHWYEPEAVETIYGGYLPDFWLPQVCLWAEVKPEAFTPMQRHKLNSVVVEDYNAHGGICLDGEPECRPYEIIYNDRSTDDVAISNKYGRAERERRFYSAPHMCDFAPAAPCSDTADAVEELKHWRFDNGVAKRFK